MEDDRWRDFSKWDEKMMQEFIRENAAAFRVFVSRYAKREEDIDDILQEPEAVAKPHAHRGGGFAPQLFLYDVEARGGRFLFVVVASQDGFAGGGAGGCPGRGRAGAACDGGGDVELSPQARRVMEMTLEERPLQEIAKELGVTVNTVKTVKYRALNRLSELLTPEDFATVVMMCCAPYLW